MYSAPKFTYMRSEAYCNSTIVLSLYVDKWTGGPGQSKLKNNYLPQWQTLAPIRTMSRTKIYELLLRN